ncbi:acyltransferase family protein [Actinoplanes subtropicus]|uniref:acyltransferase family protein n=1 Tax=Actinoplanes subtropicus TaxID=543632 RepID=UPI002480DC54|nr:acyltransferase [Actinoplanes subtropicus]
MGQGLAGPGDRTGASGTTDRSKRIAFLEGVRGVAAMLVVVQHLFAEQFPAYREWTTAHLDLGRVGVVAFFLVSGYVIPLSLAGQTLTAFAVRRFFRLYPVYWLALPVYVVANVVTNSSWEGAGPFAVILNILMLHGLLGLVSILPPAWTLSIELLFYAQSAAAKARRLLDASVHLGWAWLAFYLLLCVGERVTGRDLPTTLPMLLFVASLGHAIHLRDAAGRRAWQALLAGGVLLVPLGAYVGVDGDGQWPPFTYSVSYLGGLALFGALYALRRRAMARPLIFLGGISYAVYLFHPTLMTVFESLHGFAYVAACLVSVPLVAYVVHRLVEKPSIDIGRRLTARLRRPAPPSAVRASAAP